MQRQIFSVHGCEAVETGLYNFSPCIISLAGPVHVWVWPRETIALFCPSKVDYFSHQRSHHPLQVASLAQLLPPSFAYVSNPVPDSSLCSAAAPRLRPLQLLLPARLYRLLLPVSTLHPLQLLLAACVRFMQLLLSIASASADAPRLCPLQLLLPDCARFNCCSPIAHAQCSRTFFAKHRSTFTDV